MIKIKDFSLFPENAQRSHQNLTFETNDNAEVVEKH